MLRLLRDRLLLCALRLWWLLLLRLHQLLLLATRNCLLWVRNWLLPCLLPF
jgi:hypothetical protein